MNVGELPPPVIGLRPVAGEAAPPVANGQSAAVFALEAERVAASAPAITWLRPSADDPDRRRVAPSSIPDPEATVLADVAGAGRPRGAAIHKLIEEMVTGELVEDEGAVRERAVALLAQLLGVSDAAAPDPAEVASTAMGVLALPAVADVRGRLVPEWPILAALPDGTLVAGRADAVALDAAGEVDVVFDWKSDVEPAASSRLEHAAQMSAYVEAAGAARGAIIYLSRSEIIWIESTKTDSILWLAKSSDP